MTSSATTTAGGCTNTRCQPTVPAMESSANFTTRQRRRSARLSRQQQEPVRPRRLAISINHLWILRPSRFAEFLRLLMTLLLLMRLEIFRNLLPLWPDLKCAASAESSEQLSIPMRWIPIPISYISAKAVSHYLMSPITAKNNSLRSAKPFSTMWQRCAHLSGLQMAHPLPQRFLH